MLLDVHFPTTDGRELVFARYTEPEGSTTPTRPTRLGPARAGPTPHQRKMRGRGVAVNAEGCWDWWGYTGGNYAAQAALQMTAIMNMVNKITSGY